ncbi:MAG TPA: DUF4276 family protein [Spirochaetota bacterium]|nr:DUF4276 family protein [Spirochaetota bacterium]
MGINDGLETAPSKRLEKIISNYQKVFYGAIICQEIGIETIINKCPRFGEWIDKLILKSR